ncbi:MAG: glycosyltransferase [Ferrovibrio sp.]|uniref:glycosyltransferase family 2 protein n=1 Tax=Ferrovibrio sp. TaxID=1917215 RepID=UPI002636EF7A|nr:glycosyltransferase family 2 protein [Ferrovibrio sp.]MCW0236501.1 glycosyltransferase [Ferrovibrio sp.]
MTALPEISFVIPVYNKADVLPYVIRALAAQQPAPDAEYIFVDDSSSDASVAVLEQEASALPAVTVLRNAANAGPSIRLNQGAALARGRLLCLIDADELIVPDAVALMRHAMQQHDADMVHGKVLRSTLPAAQLVPAPLGAMPDCGTSDRPLQMILRGRGFVRMAWLVETALFRAAGGCDERLFIQDESLPLRLAATARQMVDFRGGMTCAPQAASHLSADKRQQHHDRFFAYYNLLCDQPALPAGQRRLIAATCASVAWKAVRRSGLPLAQLAVLRAYLLGKAGFAVTSEFLDQAAAAFRSLPGIRHAPAAHTRA